MKKIIIVLILALCGSVGQLKAFTFADESLKYKVTYKWGIIHKDAGKATLTLKRIGNEYHAQLTARSDPWADKIYSVRDTLTGRMSADDMRPLLYVKRTHEKGTFGHDEITYSYTPDKVTAFCSRYKLNKRGEETESTQELTSAPPAADMLSVYYLMRRLDYETMEPGTKTHATIFSGKRIEDLALTYVCRENVKLSGMTYDCYKVTFTFTRNGGTKSSESMTAWIRTDGSRIPVKVVGQLPVGKIHVLWLGE